MSNDPQADLIYAILTLDSYNRGYGSGINGLEVSTEEKSVKIGNWTIDKRDASFVFGQQAFDTGFYSIAYKNNSNDDVVIAYRGTDFNGKLSLNPFFELRGQYT